MSLNKKVVALVAGLATVALLAMFILPDAALAATPEAVAAGGILKVVLANAPFVIPATFEEASLREYKLKLVAEMKRMLQVAKDEKRELTAEEMTAYDALEAQLDPLDEKIAKAAKLSAADADVNTVRTAAARRQGVEQPRIGAGDVKTEFEHLAEFFHAVRFNPTDQRLVFDETVGANAVDLSAEMRMDNATQGGFMVPRKLLTQIRAVPPQDALVRPRASVLPSDGSDEGVGMPALDQSGSASKNMFGGMEFKWIAEGEEKPETDAKLREVNLDPKEIAGFVTVTDKLLRNWQGARAFVEKLMRDGVNAAEDYAFLRGNGVSMPLGALNAGATKWLNRANANQINYNDLVSIVSRFLMRGTQGVWSMPQAALPQIAKLKDDNNNFIWAANARDGFAGDLLGYPVRWNNRSPLLGSKGDVLLADWSQYLIKDGTGPFVAASEHVKFTSNKTVIKIFWNVDGSPWLTAPIQEENGWEVSPFVGLDVPA